jgi:nucleoside-diphosphate-sugar epimerase
MALIESAKRDLSLRETAESERRKRAEDERKAYELQQSVLLKMAAERVCHVLFASSVHATYVDIFLLLYSICI